MCIRDSNKIVGADGVGQPIVGLLTIGRRQANHRAPHRVQPQPAHWPVQTVHVDQNLVGVIAIDQGPVMAGFGIGNLEGRLHLGFRLAIHSGRAQRQRHVSVLLLPYWPCLLYTSRCV